ncbi:MAG: hypothetical protein ACREYF_01775 [Gammaproteobacteria bacterium]
MDDTLHKLRCKTYGCPKAQRGVALLLLLLITVVAASSIFVTTVRQTTTQIALDKNRQTHDALARAKEALIGYALTYSEQPPTGTPPGSQPQGFLPCPDRDGDGGANPPCGGAGQSFIGMLPWRQLRLPALRDGDGECLWYAVSGNYKNNPKISLTSDTDGQLIIKDGSGTVVVGATPSDRAIAIVFAPGAPLDIQNRGGTAGTLTECGSTTLGDPINQVANYLEAFGGINNATGTPPLPADPSVFVSPLTVGGAQNFNDTLLAITPQDFALVYNRMDRWVANRVQQCITAYGSLYPWTAALNAPSPVDPPDFNDDLSQRFGRVPDILDDSGGSWPPDPAVPVGTIVPPVYGPAFDCFEDVPGALQPGWSWWWWDTWREIVFYAVDTNYAPGGLGGAPAALQFIDTTTATPPGPPPPPSQFVVAVAGRKLGGQQRKDANDKANIASYLEDHNDPNFAATTPPGPAGNIPTGDEQFVTTPTVAGTAFNDTLCNDAGCP